MFPGSYLLGHYFFRTFFSLDDFFRPLAVSTLFLDHKNIIIIGGLSETYVLHQGPTCLIENPLETDIPVESNQFQTHLFKYTYLYVVNIQIQYKIFIFVGGGISDPNLEAG